VIRQTFLHLPGVGNATERRLWQFGFHSWDDLWTALQSGKSLRQLLSKARQRHLFDVAPEGPADAKSLAWLDCLDQSRHALTDRNYAFFLSLLRPSDQWRLLGRVLNEALYLDIETTGLSSDLHYVTVVGALYSGRFHQWVWPEKLDELAELISQAPLVVTFNGQRFDLPFLRAKAPAVPQPRAHIDLLYIARAAGFKGGQKQLEVDLGLAREADIRDLDGLAAVAAWCSALYGDRESYKQLLRYNRADVEMMPEVAARLCRKLCQDTDAMPPAEVPPPKPCRKYGHKPSNFQTLKTNWHDRRPSLQLLEPRLASRFQRMPVVVGIDLRAKPANPTGWAVCLGQEADTCILYGDADILQRTLAAKPDLVSIDAPLFLPRGRRSVSDDSPCRKKGGIVRDAERILWARGIRVYPALIRQMQGLTQRGIELTRQLERHGIKVIESYPGAAQDILNIPRKKLDEHLLSQGLAEFGYQFHGPKSHDELDAITSALVGHFFLADQYEGIGADDEGYMIIPRSSIAGPNGGKARGRRRRTVFLVGLPGAGKTTLSRALAQRLGWRCFVLGDELRDRAASDVGLRESLAHGEMAPEPLVKELVSQASGLGDEPGLLVDGFPRHPDQLPVAQELFDNWTLIHLDVTPSVALSRLQTRLVCSSCGTLKPSSLDSTTPCSTCGSTCWQTRIEDDKDTIRRRLRESRCQLGRLLRVLPEPKVIHLDAEQSVDRMSDCAVREMMVTRLA
jgi:uncharacterized protein YprB with RNaseH-like and TPR domain/predicted nuclease with RNAse H fold/adenylate kinase family enzyme